MPWSYSLLVPPLSRRTRSPQRTWFWPQPADQSVPDQPPLQQYPFRKGGFWQLLNRVVLYPVPADLSVPDAPPLTPYVFRPGGFWQPQKFLLQPRPADQSVPDAPILKAYVFRKGGFWQIQKFSVWPKLTDPVIVIAPPPPPPVAPQATGPGELGHVVFDTERRQWRPPWSWLLPEKDYDPALLALLSAGAITEEEFIALLAAMRLN